MGRFASWRVDDGAAVAMLSAGVRDPGSLAVRNGTLAFLGESGDAVHVWRFESDEILKSASASDTSRYRNAKLVLMGDSGVGKTGLALVLSGREWTATESSHGRHVWTFSSEEVTLPDGRTEHREAILWDLAGQPGYRLVHQLHLNEVAVALVVLDDRSETDPLAGVMHWDRALAGAAGAAE